MTKVSISPPPEKKIGKTAKSPTTLEEKVIAALRTVYDPEIPVNVYDLGLIYKLHIDKNGSVEIDMTLTSSNCPLADFIVQSVEVAVKKVASNVKINLVWEPVWDKERMDEATMLELNLF